MANFEAFCWNFFMYKLKLWGVGLFPKMRRIFRAKIIHASYNKKDWYYINNLISCYDFGFFYQIFLRYRDKTTHPSAKKADLKKSFWKVKDKSARIIFKNSEYYAVSKFLCINFSLKNILLVFGLYSMEKAVC